ncbi:MAG: HAD-IA family hydrolase [Planctomycetota bacterium]|jgi:2-haloalkanoic acid dehalogenase type II
MDWDTVSFDCYGTLVDWETGITDAFKAAAARDGLELEPADIIAAYHQVEPAVQADVYRSYREVLGEVALRVADRLDWQLAPDEAAFLADSLPDWPVFADTRPALQRLKSRFRIAILSNVDDDLLAGTIARIGVDFDWTVTAQQIRSYKPAHGHFLEALRRVEGDRDRLLHAAQSLFHDIRPASQLGISAVWVDRKAEGLGEEDLGPVRVVRNLTDLADWLGVR